MLDGIITGEREDGINLIALFDHEEIGSRTKQGAGSMLLRDVVEKIQISLGRDACQVKEALYQSMLLSVDVAHAMHPNQNQKADVTNQPVLNRGFCIKESGNQSYATDCEVVAIVEQICKKEMIAYQEICKPFRYCRRKYAWSHCRKPDAGTDRRYRSSNPCNAFCKGVDGSR